jgi:hypothetical protein
LVLRCAILCVLIHPFKLYFLPCLSNLSTVYVLAHQILGPRPQDIPPAGNTSIHTWQTLDLISDSPLDITSVWQDFSEAFVQLENVFPYSPYEGNGGNGSQSPSLGVIETPYFCVPKNQNLLSYWDNVDQRLFNIRHCLNLQGVSAQPALFPPPINPMLLVQAAAAGVSISSALNDIDSPVPYYRFSYMIQKALEICSDVKALGGSLLSALEKSDAEDIAMIRATQEVKLLNAIRVSKEKQIDEANANIDSLNKSLAVAQERYNYYSTRQYMSDLETQHLSLITAAWALQAISQATEIAAGASHIIPNFDLGASGISSPVVTGTFGGANLGAALETFSRAMSFLSSFFSYQGNMTSILAGYQRRNHDWQFQARLATDDIAQINSQIAAANIREKIAESDLSAHDIQIQNATDIQTWMQNKFTNKDLYDWMISQVSNVYFQSYQMAYDTAKKAEKAYQFETGDETSTFIHSGYWDDLKKGLLSGEGLYGDLKTLEKAYIDQNRRYFEITKNISLAMINPKALLDMIEKGSCTFELQDLLFDMDFPGHYRRAIKSVSITIPCVVGPYTSVNAVLTMLSSKMRTDTKVTGSPDDFYNDSNYKINYSSSQSIATSHAQNDSGMFELNFHDERYLPFEGLGVYSQWLLEMPQENFDFSTISDVIIKINYTARDGGLGLRNAAKAAYDSRLAKVGSSGLMRLFSVRHEFPSQWQNFFNTVVDGTYSSIKIGLRRQHFPFPMDFKSIKINKVALFLKLRRDKIQHITGNYLIYDLDISAAVPRTSTAAVPHHHRHADSPHDILPPTPNVVSVSPGNNLPNQATNTVTIKQNLISIQT